MFNYNNCQPSAGRFNHPSTYYYCGAKHCAYLCVCVCLSVWGVTRLQLRDLLPTAFPVDQFDRVKLSLSRRTRMQTSRWSACKMATRGYLRVGYWSLAAV